MRPKAQPILLLAFLPCFLTACHSPPNQQTGISPPHPATIEAASPASENGVDPLIQLTNQARASKGLAPLSIDPRLTRAALDHSRSMSRHAYFSHKGRDGSNFQARMLRHGYPSTYSAENIAMAHSPTIVFQMWVESRGHAKNMFNKKYTRLGISRVGSYWTAVYAAPDNT